MGHVDGAAHEIHKAAGHFIIHIIIQNNHDRHAPCQGIHSMAGITVGAGNEDIHFLGTDAPGRQRACRRNISSRSDSS